MSEDFTYYRRHLPHWRQKGATYYITFNTHEGVISKREQGIVLERIRMGDGIYYILIAAVVMPDHTHILLTPIKDIKLSRILKGIKGSTAREINILRKASGSIWQEEYYDRIIRDYEDLLDKLRYMFDNPVKKGLTVNPQAYHGWYFNEQSLE